MSSTNFINHSIAQVVINFPLALTIELFAGFTPIRRITPEESQMEAKPER